MIHIDFESRSEEDIWAAGAWIYAKDPSTEVLCLCFALGDEEPTLISMDELTLAPQLYPELFDRIQAGVPISAFNAFFEACMWQHIMVPKFKWPAIQPRQWRCSAAKAAAATMPRSLKDCGAALKAKHQKSISGKNVMLKMCKPRPLWRNKNKGPKWYDSQEDFEKLYEYCLDDIRAEREVDLMLPDLSDTEQEVWFLDQLINSRGFYVDQEAIEAALKLLNEYTERLHRETEKITDGFIDRVSRRARVMEWMENEGVELPNYQQKTVEDAIAAGNLPPKVQRILEIRLQINKISTKKYETMKASCDTDTRIRDILMYHGASTGRWAGKLVQIQNLPRGSVEDTDTCIEAIKNNTLDFFEMLYPDTMGAISSCLRGMIISAPKRDLMVADYNAIEARVVMWLAGEVAGLRKFERGEDLYVDMARAIYQKEEISKLERHLGKTAVLGCGYGMGANKFYATCQQYGLDISEELAQTAVNIYRDKYNSVKRFWYMVEQGAITAVKADKLKYQWGWRMNKNNLLYQLPSGRVLTYVDAKIQKGRTPWGEERDQLTFMGVTAGNNKWERQTTYGGKLVENITQATARDIMAHAMLNCEAKGYPVLFTVHDEIVSEVPEGFGSIPAFERILCDKPKWAEGCPIAAEGWRGKRYRK